MKKFLSIFLIIVLLFSVIFVLTGCEDKKENNNTNLTANLDYKNMTKEDLLSHIKDINNVTVDEYVWLVSTYSYVDIKEDLTLEDNITDEAINEITSAAKPSQEKYIEKLIKSESPQVRGYAVSLMPSLLGMSSKNLELAKELIKEETNEYVLYNATKALSNEAKNGKEIADFLIKMSDSENSKIRVAVASALGNSWSEGVEGAVNTVIKLMNDVDKDVRKVACKNAGKLNDESVIDPIVKILNNPEDADIHGSCIDGLVTLWYDYPFFEKYSEKAYNATMDYLKKTPRTEKIPAWTAVSSFKTTSTQNSYAEWKQKATYFNIDEIYNVMADIIKDSNANVIARTSAIDVIKAHCSEEKFKELKTTIDGLSDAKSNQIKSSYETKSK